MNIVFIGYRGTGKSAIAEQLSDRLSRPKFDMDEEIVAEAGMSIPEIVATKGWDFFRDLESEIARRASKRDQTVIDAGGGVVVRRENIKALRRNGLVIWLRADAETIADRIRTSAERPSLTGSRSFLEEIDEVLRERTPLYREAADFDIDTSRLAIETVTEKIAAWLEGRI